MCIWTPGGDIAAFRGMRARVPDGIDYGALNGLSTEVKDKKLEVEIKPRTTGRLAGSTA